MTDARLSVLSDLLRRASEAERRQPSDEECDRIEEAIDLFEHHASATVEELRGALAYARQDNLPRHRRPVDHV